MPERTGIVTRAGHICMICGHIPTTKNKYRELQDHLVRKHFNDRIKAALPIKRPYLCPEPQCKIEGKDWQALMRHYTGKHGVLETYLRQIIDSGMALPPNPKHSKNKAKQQPGQTHVAPTQDQIDEILTTKLDPNMPVHVPEKVGKSNRRKRPSHNSTGSSCGQDSLLPEEETDDGAPQYALVIKRSKTGKPGEETYHLLDLKSLLACSKSVSDSQPKGELLSPHGGMITSQNQMTMPHPIPAEPIPLPELVQAQMQQQAQPQIVHQQGQLLLSQGGMMESNAPRPNVVFSQAHQQLVVSHQESVPSQLKSEHQAVSVEDLNPTVYQQVYIQNQDNTDPSRFQFQTQHLSSDLQPQISVASQQPMGQDQIYLQQEDPLQQALKQIYVNQPMGMDEQSFIIQQDNGQVLSHDGNLVPIYLSPEGIPLHILNQPLHQNDHYQIVQTVQELEDESAAAAQAVANQEAILTSLGESQGPHTSVAEERVIVEEVHAIPIEETSSAEDTSSSSKSSEAAGIVSTPLSATLVAVTASNQIPKMAEKEAINRVNNNNNLVECKSVSVDPSGSKCLKSVPNGVKEIDFSMF